MDSSSDDEEVYHLPPAPIKQATLQTMMRRATLNGVHQSSLPKPQCQEPAQSSTKEHSTDSTARLTRQQARSTSADALPGEIMQNISALLELTDLLSASQVCHSWLDHLRAGITHLRMHIASAKQPKKGRMASVARLAPHLKSLRITLGTLAGQDALHAFFEDAPHMPLLQSMKLDFCIPAAPRRGMWPLFFWNILPCPALAHVTELVCCGSPMPSVSISGLLATVQGLPNLNTLVLDSRPHPTSTTQLPPLAPPKWLTPVGGPKQQEHTGVIEAVHLAPLAMLTQLRDLQIQLDPALAADDAYGRIGVLTHLTGLTSLDLYHGAPVDSASLELLAQMTRLRCLRVGLLPSVSLAAHSPLARLAHVEEIRLRIYGPHLPSQLCWHLPTLNTMLGSRLQWLQLANLAWASYMPECLAAFEGLRSLHLELGQSPEGGATLVDLRALTQLTAVESFSLVFATPGMSLHTLACEDLLRCWGSKLLRLRLEGIRGSEMPHIGALKGALGGLQHLVLCCQPGAGCGSMDLHDLPSGINHLDLGDWQLDLVPQWADHDTPILPECRHVSLKGGFILCRALTRLLSDMATACKLHSLELVHVGPSLSNDSFEAIGYIHSLTSLSIVASGNVTVTHAALAHLAPLKQLEVLRWHVGDVLDQLPLPQALAHLQKLVAWCIVPSLHAQLERWDNYAILQALPQCDVWVETGL